MKKKIFSFALVISIIVSLFVALPGTANAETDGIFTYTIENGEVTITDCDETVSGDITVPDTLDGYPVTTIGKSAFCLCKNITGITLPDGITFIGSLAFSNCTNLSQINIPDSVTTISTRAFLGCENLTNITIPEGVTDIGHSAFSDCTALTEVIIPDSVTSMGQGVFSGCKSVTYASFSRSMTDIPHSILAGCTNLNSVTIHANIKTISDGAFLECSSLKSIVFPYSLESIGNGAFLFCNNLKNIYYNGTEDMWNAIEIDINNDALKNADITFKTAYFRGDATGDSHINIKDVISLRRHIAGGYNEIVVHSALDTNKDDDVDVRDIVTLRRYIAGGYGVELIDFIQGSKFEVVIDPDNMPEIFSPADMPVASDPVINEPFDLEASDKYEIFDSTEWEYFFTDGTVLPDDITNIDEDFFLPSNDAPKL